MVLNCFLHILTGHLSKQIIVFLIYIYIKLYLSLLKDVRTVRAVSLA